MNSWLPKVGPGRTRIVVMFIAVIAIISGLAIWQGLDLAQVAALITAAGLAINSLMNASNSKDDSDGGGA